MFSEVADFFWKRPVVNILDFASHMVSVAPAQLYCFCAKALLMVRKYGFLAVFQLNFIYKSKWLAGFSL